MIDLGFSSLAGAVIAASSGRDAAFANRLGFWIEFFGQRPVTTLITDDVEDGVKHLVGSGELFRPDRARRR
ncbi:MAG: hypothetical protein FD187_2253 [bacterium]|nr:MAG: hypothetical protein FD142_2776 [bacterium]KAF0148040.1 MAG: hypothetical protein FD187_2253 [bacterium]KAF0167556.1 MAG: hypothetical protein FD158_2134 [bacterium]TXT16640.1 MAG: hypothetical protein FD132_2749 [bacterium]